MKAVPAIILAILLYLPSACIAQNQFCSESGWQTEETVGAKLTITDALGRNLSLNFEIIFEYHSQEPVAHRGVIPVESIEFASSSDSNAINELPVWKLFDSLSMAAMRIGVAKGYFQCGSVCPGTDSFEIRQAACVKREGSGIETRFVPCEGYGCSGRRFSACCPSSGTPTILPVGADPGMCNSDTCKATCP